MMEYKFHSRCRAIADKNASIFRYLELSSIFWNYLIDRTIHVSTQYLKTDLVSQEEFKNFVLQEAVDAIDSIQRGALVGLEVQRCSELKPQTLMFRANDLVEAYNQAKFTEESKREDCIPRKKNPRSSQSARFVYGDYSIRGDGGVLVSPCPIVEFKLLDHTSEEIAEIIEKKATMTLTLPNKRSAPRRFDEDEQIFTVTFSVPLLSDVDKEEITGAENTSSETLGQKLMKMFRKISIHDGKEKRFLQQLSDDLFDAEPKLSKITNNAGDPINTRAVVNDIMEFAKARLESAQR